MMLLVIPEELSDFEMQFEVYLCHFQSFEIMHELIFVANVGQRVISDLSHQDHNVKLRLPFILF